MLKTLDEIKQALNLMDQETDASKRTKSRHLLEYQFRMALDQVASLQQANNALRRELEQVPEYRQRQAFNLLTPYIEAYNKS